MARLTVLIYRRNKHWRSRRLLPSDPYLPEKDEQVLIRQDTESGEQFRWRVFTTLLKLNRPG